MTDPHARHAPTPAEYGAAMDEWGWPRQFHGLVGYLADELSRPPAACAPETARSWACRLAARLACEYRGDHLYIPKGDALDRLIRDARVHADYQVAPSADTVKAIALREGLTPIHTYRIIAAQRKLARRGGPAVAGAGEANA